MAWVFVCPTSVFIFSVLTLKRSFRSFVYSIIEPDRFPPMIWPVRLWYWWNNSVPSVIIIFWNQMDMLQIIWPMFRQTSDFKAISRRTGSNRTSCSVAVESSSGVISVLASSVSVKTQRGAGWWIMFFLGLKMDMKPPIFLGMVTTPPIKMVIFRHGFWILPTLYQNCHKLISNGFA